MIFIPESCYSIPIVRIPFHHICIATRLYLYLLYIYIQLQCSIIPFQYFVVAEVCSPFWWISALQCPIPIFQHSIPVFQVSIPAVRCSISGFWYSVGFRSGNSILHSSSLEFDHTIISYRSSYFVLAFRFPV